MKKFFTTIYNIISPKNIKCIICDNELDRDIDGCVCDKCLQALPVISKACNRCGAEIYSSAKYCIHCKDEQRHFDKAIAPFTYQNQISNLVYRLKYGDETYLAEYLAHFMIQKLSQEKLDFDIVVPVPLSKQRQKLRTYNQAELLAKYIAEYFDKPLNNSALIRKVDTKTQTHLSRTERQQNLKGAFEITSKSEVKDKVVLLVDDIFTTGSTADEISKILKNAKAKTVYVITFAHAINQKEVGFASNNKKNS